VQPQPAVVGIRVKKVKSPLGLCRCALGSGADGGGRLILKAEGVSWHAVKTWKAGTDPEFSAKMNRILDLYGHRPAYGRVVCVAEFGPLNLQPRAGQGWLPRRRPRRLRATYHRAHGVRHLLGVLDLANGKIQYRIRDR